MNIGGGVLDGLGLGLGLWGTYLLLSNESITNELEALESVSRNDERRKQTGSELLLESYANQERMWRYLKASSAIALGLASGVSPLFTSASAETKVSTALVGGAAVSYGVFRALFPTKAEDFWETYKRDKKEARQGHTENIWMIAPTAIHQNGSTNLGIGFYTTF